MKKLTNQDTKHMGSNPTSRKQAREMDMQNRKLRQRMRKPGNINQAHTQNTRNSICKKPNTNTKMPTMSKGAKNLHKLFGRLEITQPRTPETCKEKTKATNRRNNKTHTEKQTRKRRNEEQNKRAQKQNPKSTNNTTR